MKGTLKEACNAALSKHTALLDKATDKYDTATQWLEASSFMQSEKVFTEAVLERAKAQEEINMYKNYIKITKWFLDIVENPDTIYVDTSRFKGENNV